MCSVFVAHGQITQQIVSSMRQTQFSGRMLTLIWLLVISSCLVKSDFDLAEKINVSPAYDYNDAHFEKFIENIENLVMNTTNRALLVTKNVYLNLNQTMPQTLRDASQTLLQTYIKQVNSALQQNATYAEKRKLFQQFRANNRHIEQLRKQFAPQEPEFQFQLISERFYNSSGHNSTEFDNLYLEFMQKFEHESKQLWQNLSENTVEHQEELLELLDEIDSEHQLREKDKLYDEFIEMFLFKTKIENRELD